MPRMKGGKIPDVFATRDEDLHRRMRRPVANLYSVTSLLTLEPLMTSTMQFFFSRLDDLFTDKGVDVDLFQWIQYFMFDVLGEVTFSRRLGCLDKGGDVDGVIQGIWLYFKKIAAVRVHLKTLYLGRLDLVTNNTWTFRTPRCNGSIIYGGIIHWSPSRLRRIRWSSLPLLGSWSEWVWPRMRRETLVGEIFSHVS